MLQCKGTAAQPVGVNPSQLLDPLVAAQRLVDVKSGAVQMMGINLGSWLVLEQYMVPNIYALVKYTPAVVGERDLMTVRMACPYWLQIGLPTPVTRSPRGLRLRNRVHDADSTPFC